MFGSAVCRLWGQFVGTYSSCAYARWAGRQGKGGPARCGFARRGGRHPGAAQGIPCAAPYGCADHRPPERFRTLRAADRAANLWCGAERLEVRIADQALMLRCCLMTLGREMVGVGPLSQRGDRAPQSPRRVRRRGAIRRDGVTCGRFARPSRSSCSACCEPWSLVGLEVGGCRGGPAPSHEPAAATSSVPIIPF